MPEEPLAPDDALPGLVLLEPDMDGEEDDEPAPERESGETPDPWARATEDSDATNTNDSD